MMQELEILEALWTLRHLPPEQLPDFAVRLLQAGYDSPAIVELAGMHKPTLREAGDLFEQVLRDIKMPRLSKEQAGQAYARQVALAIVQKEIDSIEGAYKISGVWSETGHPENLAPFVYLAEEYDSLPGFISEEEIEKSREEVSLYIVETAREFLSSVEAWAI